MVRKFTWFANGSIERWQKAWWTLLGSALVAGLLIQTSSAQVTKEMLIGDSVSEIGNRYPEIDKAIERFTNADYVGARLLLDDAKRKDASLPPTDLIMAKLYNFARDEAGARNAYEATITNAPNDPEVFMILANQVMQVGRTIEGEALYDKALALNEKFTDNAKRKRNVEIRSRLGRAIVAERRKNWPAAAADLRALLKIDPDNAVAHYRLGAALFMQAKAGPDFAAGYEEFKKAKELDKEKSIPNANVSAALWYDQLGKKNEAQTMFNRAIAEDRTNVVTLNAYANWLIKTGSIEKAESVLAESRKADPTSLEALIYSGVAARMAKKMKPAEDYFLQALSIQPSNGVVLNQLALLLIDQMDDAKKNRALQFAHINSRLNAQNSEAQITLAWVLYQLGRMQEAQAALNEGTRLGMGNLTPDSGYILAKIMVEQNRGEAAKEILTSALGSDNQGIFVNRQDAQALLATLDKK